MRVRRLLAVLFSALLVGTLVAGCGGSRGKQEGQPPATETGSGQEQPAQQEPAQTEPVVIRWATWMGEEDVKRTIEAFERTHPHIKVEWDQSITWPWNEKLAAAAAAGNLPDVLWTFGVPTAVTNGWLEDLTPYLEADPEFQEGKVFMNLVDTARYNGKIYALPHSLYAFVIYLNLDLFEKENVKVPEPNWTVDQFRETAVALTKFNERQFGFRTANPLREWLPSAFDANLGWNTFDGEKFNFNTPAFKQTVDFVNRLMKVDKIAVESYPPEQREAWYGKDKDPWFIGKLAMVHEGTWALGGYQKDLQFKWDVRPIPGAQGQRIPLVTDYVGIAKTSQHKKEAFEFVKWLTYSKEGWMERVKPEWPLGSMPLINDQEVWEAWLSRPNMPPGLKDIVKLIPNGIVDPLKWVPGYEEALKIFHETFKQVDEGQAKIEDIAPDMERRMNEAYRAAVEQLNQATQ